MVAIYVLKCEDGKYYVGKTEHPETRFKAHFGKTGGSKWTKKHQPEKILYFEDDLKDVDENRITFEKMKQYGVRNVRGGDYCTVNMSERSIRKLEVKLGLKKKTTSSIIKRMITLKKVSSSAKRKSPVKKSATTSKCSRCGRTSHTSSECFANSTLKGKSLKEKPKVRSKVSKTKKSPAKKPATTSKCSRCGRKNHTSSECFAHSTSEGQTLKIKSNQKKNTSSLKSIVKRMITPKKVSSSSKRRTSVKTPTTPSKCTRCGRTSHTSSECFAHSTSKGKSLKAKPKVRSKVSKTKKSTTSKRKRR